MLLLAIAIVNLFIAILATHVSLFQPEEQRAKRLWRTILIGLALLAFCLAGRQLQLDAREKRNRYPVPSLPLVSLTTLDGLPNSITNDRPNIRMHRIRIANFTDVTLDNFVSRLQLPEPIVTTTQTNLPPGTVIDWRPVVVDMVFQGTGGRSDTGFWIGPTSKVHFVYPYRRFYPPPKRQIKMEYSGAGDVTGVWELAVDSIPPRSALEIKFLTSSATNAQNYLRFANEPFWKSYAKQVNQMPMEDTNELNFYFEGEYQYPADGKPGRQQFFVPLVFAEAERKISSLATHTNSGQWNVVFFEKY
jgi:hypothetical protein